MMESFASILSRTMSRTNQVQGDYISGGILYCGKCHTPKQHQIQIDGVMMNVPIYCKCMQEAEESKLANTEAAQKKAIAEDLRRLGMPGKAAKCTFENSVDAPDGITNACKKYVENWDKMQRENIGILFQGDIGTGKSYIAYSIGNALIDHCVPVIATNMPTVLNKLQSSFGGRQEYIDRLSDIDLLILDDLGADRGSEYALEQIYSLIETRSLSQKPLIVTTNIPISEMQSTPDITKKRIYNRIIEMCPIVLTMAGKSRREGNAEKRKELAREILGGHHD